MTEVFANTGLKVNGTDLKYVTKDYLRDLYPNLSNSFKTAGLWVWGRNNYGQLGDNTNVNKSSPIQTIAGGTNWKQVSCGGHTFVTALKTDGTLWLWGRNSYGQLGDNSVVHKSSPVQTVSGGTNWLKISAGGRHVGAIKTDGTLWLWGNATYGQLGANSITQRSSPVQTVSGGTNWKQVSCGYFHTVAIKTDGTLWTWGRNNDGQLGNNDATHRSSPVQTVAGGTDWWTVAAGTDHTLATKTDGTLWMWGQNSNGQLGTDDRTHRSSPVQTVAGGTNWDKIYGGGDRAAAIKTDGTLWVWGQDNSGSLGIGVSANRSSPVQTVAGGTNWRAIGGGSSFSAAIKTDGTLWTWGNNNYGTLGINNTSSRSSPVQTIAAGTNWKTLSTGIGSNPCVVIRDDSSDPI